MARVRRGRAGAPPLGRWGCGRSCRDRAAPLGPGLRVVGDASCRLWHRPPAATPRSSVTSGVKSDPDTRAAFCAVRSVPVIVTFQARFG